MLNLSTRVRATLTYAEALFWLLVAPKTSVRTALSVASAAAVFHSAAAPVPVMGNFSLRVQSSRPSSVETVQNALALNIERSVSLAFAPRLCSNIFLLQIASRHPCLPPQWSKMLNSCICSVVPRLTPMIRDAKSLIVHSLWNGFQTLAGTSGADSFCESVRVFDSVLRRCAAGSLPSDTTFSWVSSVTEEFAAFVLSCGGWCVGVRMATEPSLRALESTFEFLIQLPLAGLLRNPAFLLHFLYLISHIFLLQTNYLEQVPLDVTSLLLWNVSLRLLRRFLPNPVTSPLTVNNNELWQQNIEPLIECMIMLDYGAVDWGQDLQDACLRTVLALDVTRWNLVDTLHMQALLAFWCISGEEAKARAAPSSLKRTIAHHTDDSTRVKKSKLCAAASLSPPADGSRAAPLPMHDSTADWRAGRYRELRQRLDDDGFLFVRGVIEEPVVLGAREKLVNQRAAKGLTLPGSDPMEALAAHPIVVGYTVDALTGHVYMHRERITSTGTAAWAEVGNSPQMRQVYAGDGLRRFYQLLFQDDADYVARPEWSAAGIAPYTMLLESTWLRAKGGGESTIPHADWMHFADNTTALGDYMTPSAHRSDGAVEQQDRETCNICGMDDDSTDTLICDVCSRGFHGGCLQPPLSAAILAKAIHAESQEWHCHDCCELPVPYWTAWIPLGRIAEGDGRLMLLPRSHRGYGGYRSSQKERELPAQFNAAAHKAAQWCAPTAGMEAGDLILFNLKTIHAATANGRSKLRLSMDTRVTTGKGRRFREDHGLSGAPAAAAAYQRPVQIAPRAVTGGSAATANTAHDSAGSSF